MWKKESQTSETKSSKRNPLCSQVCCALSGEYRWIQVFVHARVKVQHSGENHVLTTYFTGIWPLLWKVGRVYCLSFSPMRVIGGFYNLRLWADCGLGYISFLVSLKQEWENKKAKRTGKKCKKEEYLRPLSLIFRYNPCFIFTPLCLPNAKNYGSLTALGIMSIS